jgi:hypothetical protein
MGAIESMTANNHEIKDFSNYDIYPNPCNGLLYIKPNESIKNMSVEITNINGQIMYTNIFDNNFANNISNFRQGVYFIRLFVKME